ncbi:hypothetical protein C1H46_017277 [Malus baccata]|uniref:Rab-GAP TBC domain-containing protein n=1 Tax=Malus baccata TaxID=106549 RepID=A0A540MEL3_MALBA|nr:hypothetical protein C1H46_017277 [Malus baccata]
MLAKFPSEQTSQITTRKFGDFSYCDRPADGNVDAPLKRCEISEEDHPLSLGINEKHSSATCKLNPAIRYVQGMNEVLAPINYVLSTDTNEQNTVRESPGNI